MKLHTLKIKYKYFEQVLRGNKRFELRYNDRDFQINDLIHFVDDHGKEYDYFDTNLFKITYVLKGKDAEQYGLQEGYCILSIAELCHN